MPGGMMTRLADASDVPRLVADKLARRCWSVSRDDLRQEAEVAAIHMRTLYEPAKGDLRGYLYRGIARHLTNYMWEQGSIVSYKHRRNELRATTSVSVDKAVAIADPAVDVEGQTMAATWRLRVVDRVMELAGKRWGELVAPCLFDAGSPLDVAKAQGVPLLYVLETMGKVRDLINDDPVMKNLYTEMP